MKLRKGTKIRHPKKPDWGLGKILEASNGEEIRAFFVNAGEKKLMLKYVEPEVVPAAEGAHPVLDNLRSLSADDTVKYQSLPHSIDAFLSKYPEAFDSEAFIQQERDVKMSAHILGLELLSETELTSLLQAENYEEVCKRAMKVVGKTTLVFPNEKMALKNGLATPYAQQDFAKNLYELLYGDEEISRRFTVFARHLEDIDAAKWTIATYFLFIMQQDKYMFVKPTVTQHAANLCGFEIHYKPKLNWQTYEAVLTFAEYLRSELAEMKPQDMIDIQSFMWCISQK